MGLGASTHAKMATAENPLDGLARGTADLAHFDEHLAKAKAKLAELRAAFAWPHPPGCDDERGADVAALPLERMAEMLSAGDLALEQGYVRCDDGTYFAASRARMPNVTGAMLQWWFTWCDVGYKYILWHPEDHTWCTWSWSSSKTTTEKAPLNRRPGSWIGESHIVVEHMGRAFGGPAEDVRIEFRDPAVYGLTPEAIAAARPRVVAVFTARICACEPGLGDISAGHFIHIARETTDGTGDIELRSRFWIGRDVEKLGDGLLPPAWLIRVIGSLKLVKYLKVPRARASGIMRHAFEEFNTLGAILPDLFEQEASSDWKELSEIERTTRQS